MHMPFHHSGQLLPYSHVFQRTDGHKSARNAVPLSCGSSQTPLKIPGSPEDPLDNWILNYHRVLASGYMPRLADTHTATDSIPGL